jgi:Asp-tRNA(Asn)/Glu-tRNA(Gln) amidotransferase C subunit
VSEVSELVAEEADATPSVGPVHNVFRIDEVTNEADQYTEDILNEMPAKEGRYMEVKKILQTD